MKRLLTSLTALFLLASFGDSFSLLAEDVPAEQLAARMAEIPMDEKNSVSHRGNAVRLLIDALKSKGLI